MLSVTINPRVCIYDREPVIEQLKRAYVEGRLDDAELDLRMGRALTVTTLPELESLLSDLPRPGVFDAGGAATPFLGHPARRRPHLERRSSLARKLKFTVLIVISATVGTAVLTYYWAVLITAGMSLHLVK